MKATQQTAGNKHQGTESEFTVVQKSNQGSLQKKGCNLLSGSFFGTFLEKQKST
jgi:hypothetical protein